MSDEIETESQTESAQPRAGLRLRALRESRNIDLAELARRLHVDVATLQAIEENRFGDLGAPVFAKGHLRKYAAALGVPDAEIVAEYYELHRESELPPVVAPRTPLTARSRFEPFYWGLAVAFIVLALLLWWFLRADPAESVGGTPSPAASPGSATTALAERDDAGPAVTLQQLAVSPREVSSPPETGIAAEPVASPAEPVAAPVPDDGMALLVLEFSDECWTDVRGADGRRLFSGTARAGQTEAVRGRPPFSLVLGNARAVAIHLDDTPYPVPASALRGRIARFQIDRS